MCLKRAVTSEIKCALNMISLGGGGGGGVLGLIFAGYVPLASLRPHLNHFWANIYTFAIPT